MVGHECVTALQHKRQSKTLFQKKKKNPTSQKMQTISTCNKSGTVLRSTRNTLVNKENKAIAHHEAYTFMGKQIRYE